MKTPEAKFNSSARPEAIAEDLCHAGGLRWHFGSRALETWAERVAAMIKQRRAAATPPDAWLSDRPRVRLGRSVRLLYHRQKKILRSWLVFLVLLEGMHLLLDWSGPRVWDFLDTSTARVTCWALSLLGVDAQAQGKDIYSSIFSMRIIRECTAVHPILIYVAAVVAYPCAWLPRLLGIGAGSLAILIVNQLRLITLFYVGHWFPALFETAHMLVWQSLIIFVTVLFWMVWASIVNSRHDYRAA